MCFRTNVTGPMSLCAALSACITDSVPPNAYVSDPAASSGDGSVDGGSRARRDAQAATELDSGPEGEPDLPVESDAGAEPVDPMDPSEPVDNGPCDLTGSWLVTQHGVYQALGVKQTSMTWYYYELTQSGGNLTVKKGLACGAKVIPKDLAGAGVTWEAAWPTILAKNSHAGRTGQVSASGANCSVSFEPTTTILGATVAHYSDINNDLPTVNEQASGEEPGWEDWDNDGKPGISFYVTGFATGTRYSVQRVYNDWTDGSYAPGAKLVKLVAVAQQDESVLGATSDLIKTLSAPDSDPSTGFTQFARLDTTQAQGDDAALCATVRELAPTLTPEANRK
jgi:hypothetical protein